MRAFWPWLKGVTDLLWNLGPLRVGSWPFPWLVAEHSSKVVTWNILLLILKFLILIPFRFLLHFCIPAHNTLGIYTSECASATTILKAISFIYYHSFCRLFYVFDIIWNNKLAGTSRTKMMEPSMTYINYSNIMTFASSRVSWRNAQLDGPRGWRFAQGHASTKGSALQPFPFQSLFFNLELQMNLKKRWFTRWSMPIYSKLTRRPARQRGDMGLPLFR